MTSQTSSLRYVDSLLHLTILTFVDLEDAELPRLHHHCAVFRNVRLHVDLPTTLPQSEDPLGCSDGIPHGRAFRTELGDATVQMLDQPVHHVRATRQPASGQPLLALLDSAHLSELRLQQRKEG